MSTEVTDEEIEEVLLEVLRENLKLNPLGPHTIDGLCELCKYEIKTLDMSNKDNQRRVLTGIHYLFLKGYLAWGYDFINPSPPFINITHRGKEMLKKHI